MDTIPSKIIPGAPIKPGTVVIFATIKGVMDSCYSTVNDACVDFRSNPPAAGMYRLQLRSSLGVDCMPDITIEDLIMLGNQLELRASEGSEPFGHDYMRQFHGKDVNAVYFLSDPIGILLEPVKLHQ
jgi:hypothetical protein